LIRSFHDFGFEVGQYFGQRPSKDRPLAAAAGTVSNIRRMHDRLKQEP
jgi:hypothetical protein